MGGCGRPVCPSGMVTPTKLTTGLKEAGVQLFSRTTSTDNGMSGKSIVKSHAALNIDAGEHGEPNRGTAACLQGDAREPVSKFSHDCVNLIQLQEVRLLGEFGPPLRQHSIFAGFLWLVIGFLNHLLDGHFPVSQLHGLLLAVFPVSRRLPRTASPQCVQVYLHFFGREWLRIPVVPPPFPKFSILLVRQIMGRALYPSPRSLGGHGPGGVSGPHCPDQVSPHWQNGYNLADAWSIHKSQGIGSPCVVIPVHTQHYLMLQRNLLYTAVTRGKQLVVLVGTKKVLGMAVHRQDTSRQYTALRMRLQAAQPFV